MITIYDLETAQLTAPRRVLKYVLIWCSEGELLLRIDDKSITLKQGDLTTITSGQVHFIIHQKDVSGYVLEFTYDFFCKDDKDIELIFHNGLFCHFDENEVIAIPDSSTISMQIDLIKEELGSQPYQYLTSIHSRLELILVEINRIKVNNGDEIWKPDALFLKFLELIRTNFAKNVSLREMAQRLQTTEAKLNELAKLHTGKTAQMVIHSLITSEAKRLLLYEKLTIKEIAYQLGFNDPFYFSNFFKKQTQTSPKAYREAFG